jgi:hypothetical protein
MKLSGITCVALAGAVLETLTFTVGSAANAVGPSAAVTAENKSKDRILTAIFQAGEKECGIIG